MMIYFIDIKIQNYASPTSLVRLTFLDKVEFIKKHFKNNNVSSILEYLSEKGYFLCPATNVLIYSDVVPFDNDIMLSETDICEVNLMSDKIEEQPIEFINFLYNLIKE